MSETLKPCPFCGGDSVVLYPPTCKPSTPYNPVDRLYPTARCAGCGAESYGKNEDYKGHSAVEAWNRRASPTGGDAPSEKLGPYGCLCPTLAIKMTGDGCHMCAPSEPAPVDADELVEWVSDEILKLLQGTEMPVTDSIKLAIEIVRRVATRPESGTDSGVVEALREVLDLAAERAWVSDYDREPLVEQFVKDDRVRAVLARLTDTNGD